MRRAFFTMLGLVGLTACGDAGGTTSSTANAGGATGTNRDHVDDGHIDIVDHVVVEHERRIGRGRRWHARGDQPTRRVSGLDMSWQ